jgi:hypothetical protein
MTAEIPAYIDNLTDRVGLRNLMANARSRGREDVYWAAFRRLCAVEGMNYDDPLHRDFYQVLAAYEELLTEKNGRTTKASRTRQKLARHSVEKCLEDWALSDAPTQGFDLLVQAGMPELTAEYLVTQYPDRFSVEAVNKAKARLEVV